VQGNTVDGRGKPFDAANDENGLRNVFESNAVRETNTRATSVVSFERRHAPVAKIGGGGTPWRSTRENSSGTNGFGRAKMRETAIVVGDRNESAAAIIITKELIYIYIGSPSSVGVFFRRIPNSVAPWLLKIKRKLTRRPFSVRQR